MRAAVLRRPGPPTAFTVEEVPQPTVGPGDVLIEVACCGVSHHDVVERNGTYRRDMSFPIVIGYEIAGVVAEVGSLVAGLERGDHVCTKAFASCGHCRFCRNGRETTCLDRRPVRGGYAEFASVPSDAVVKVPPIVPFEVACFLGPTVGVALNAVRDVAHVAIGETVLVTGPSGGVGSVTLQMAKLAGASVIAVTRWESKRDVLRESGADHVVVAAAGDDFSGQIRDVTDGRGVDVVIDSVGSPVFDASFRALALHGRYVLVGEVAGEDVSLSLARMFFKRAQMLTVGSVSRSQLEDAVRLVEAEAVRPMIARVLPLEEIARAHELAESGELSGRVVISPRSPEQHRSTTRRIR
jgi:acryloyl-coenzyme A reductase